MREVGEERERRTSGAVEREGGRGRWRTRPVVGWLPLEVPKKLSLLKRERVNEEFVIWCGRAWCCQACFLGEGGLVSYFFVACEGLRLAFPLE